MKLSLSERRINALDIDNLRGVERTGRVVAPWRGNNNSKAKGPGHGRRLLSECQGLITSCSRHCALSCSSLVAPDELVLLRIYSTLLNSGRPGGWGSHVSPKSVPCGTRANCRPQHPFEKKRSPTVQMLGYINMDHGACFRMDRSKYTIRVLYTAYACRTNF